MLKAAVEAATNAVAKAPQGELGGLGITDLIN